MDLKTLLTGGPKPTWIRYVFLIGIFTLLIRIILDSRFSHSAILYVLIPYLISIALYYFIPRRKGYSRLAQFGHHMLLALIVMLSTSVILFEGFICVIMFLPIYTLFAAIAYAVNPKKFPKSPQDKDIAKVSIAPLLIIILSLEGLTDRTSFNRSETITVVQTTDLDTGTLKDNLLKPIVFPDDRKILLSLFPLPEVIEDGSLNVGDIHKLKFIYNRWFFTNTHEGEMWVRFEDVRNDYIQTKIIKNTSYLSTYIDISGTEIFLSSLPSGQTEIKLSIHYQRKLDPAWYFSPLQKHAVTQSAHYLIQNIMIKSTPHA